MPEQRQSIWQSNKASRRLYANQADGYEVVAALEQYRGTDRIEMLQGQTA